MDFKDLNKVLDYFDKDNESYYDVLDGTAIVKRVEEIWEWISEHPNYKYPKNKKGWVNFINTQFCKRGDLIKGDEIVKYMIDEEYIYKRGDRIFINE